MPETRTYLHCRMDAETLAALDRLAEHHGLRTRTDMIRVLVSAEARKVERGDRPKKTAKPAQ